MSKTFTQIYNKCIRQINGKRKLYHALNFWAKTRESKGFQAIRSYMVMKLQKRKELDRAREERGEDMRKRLVGQWVRVGMMRIDDKLPPLRGTSIGMRSVSLMMKYGLIWYHKYLAARARRMTQGNFLIEKPGLNFSFGKTQINYRPPLPTTPKIP